MGKCPEVERIPGKVSGKWLFTRTRLPVSAILTNLASGASLDDVSDWFDIPRGRVERMLQFLAEETDVPLPVPVAEEPVLAA